MSNSPAPLAAVEVGLVTQQCIICGHAGTDSDTTCTQCGGEMVPLSEIDCEGGEADAPTMHDMEGMSTDSEEEQAMSMDKPRHMMKMAGEAKLSYKQRKGLPSSAFLYKSPDGKLHLPFRNSSGGLDKAHIRAIVQWGIAKMKGVSPEVKARLMAKAKRLAKSVGIQTSEQTEMTEPIIETFTDSVYAVPILEATVNAQGYHHGKLLISKADYVNRNNRVYPLEIWQREVASHKAGVKAGTLTGQAEHPAGRPQLLDQFLKFTGLQLEGKDVYATFDVIPTSKGRDFAEIARAGVRIGTSTRGAGSTKREKNGGREVSVIQPDYELQGIDVMLFGEQSVEDAGMIQFESLEPDNAVPNPETQPPTESDMPVIETVEALREAYPDLVGAIEAPFITTINLAGEREAETHQANEAIAAQLTEAQANAQTLTGQLAEANQKLEEANASLNTLTESKAAFARLHELAKELPHGSWLVVEHLKDVSTVAQVEAEFPRVKALVEKSIDHAITGMGTQIARAEDEDIPQAEPKDDNSKTETIKGDRRILSAAGAISFRKP